MVVKVSFPTVLLLEVLMRRVFVRDRGMVVLVLVAGAQMDERSIRMIVRNVEMLVAMNESLVVM